MREVLFGFVGYGVADEQKGQLGHFYIDFVAKECLEKCQYSEIEPQLILPLLHLFCPTAVRPSDIQT